MIKQILASTALVLAVGATTEKCSADWPPSTATDQQAPAKPPTANAVPPTTVPPVTPVPGAVHLLPGYSKFEYVQSGIKGVCDGTLLISVTPDTPANERLGIQECLGSYNQDQALQSGLNNIPNG